MVSGTEAWLLAGCAYQKLTPPVLLPTPGLGQYLQKTHGHVVAVAFPVLPMLQKKTSASRIGSHFGEEGRCRILATTCDGLQDVGWHAHLVALRLHGRKKKTKVVDAAFAVSVPLVAAKLFHRLDPMAQHAIHGCDTDTCTARGKVPTSKERGVLVERFLKFAAFSNSSES